MANAVVSTATSQRKFLDDGNPDGTQFSRYPRGNPAQTPVQTFGGGQIVTYQQSLSPVSILSITAAEQSLTVGTTAGNGPATTDFLLNVSKVISNQTGLGVHSARISAANTIYLTFSNPTATNGITPTANQAYNIVCLRGAVTNTQTLTPTAVPAKSTSEQIFNITQTKPVINLTVNSSGTIITATIANGGAGFYKTPTLSVVDIDGSGLSRGKNAILKAHVNTSGVIDQVFIQDGGINYVAPTVTAMGGNDILPGQVVAINQGTSADAGLAIGNVRVSAKNQIAIEWVNPTAGILTPQSQSYVILALGDIAPISNIRSFGVSSASMVSIVSITSTETSLTVNGILATDIVIGTQKPSLQAGIALAGSRAAANAVLVGIINASASTVTPSTSEIYGVTVMTQAPVVPFQRFMPSLVPVSIAASTCAEQSFAVTGLPYINSSPATVIINKQSYQPGLAIAGARISAAGVLYINYENVSAVAITPTSEQYVIGCVMEVGAGTGVPGNWVADMFQQSNQDVYGLTQELADNAFLLGEIAGA